jgi:small subunit ribosomal protein S1
LAQVGSQKSIYHRVYPSDRTCQLRNLEKDPIFMINETEAVVSEIIEPVVVESAVVEAVAVEPTVVELAVVEPVTVQAETVAAAQAADLAPAIAPSDATVATDASAVNDGGQRVVRTLSVGQEVLGTVKRTSEFGAFIDIGVGRDGLVHVSELSTKRVAKVTDVLAQGQQATFWIKELDRERNRISLTMISPGTKTVRDMQKGDLINGVVTRIMPYGAFVDIGIGRDALLHVREMAERFVPKADEVLKVGETIEARIIEIERRRARVDLSIKGLRPDLEPEPEPEAPAATASGAKGEAAKAEQEQIDRYADLPTISAFEAALKRAQSAAESARAAEKAKKAANAASQKMRTQQEDIFARTLQTR